MKKFYDDGVAAFEKANGKISFDDMQAATKLNIFLKVCVENNLSEKDIKTYQTTIDPNVKAGAVAGHVRDYCLKAIERQVVIAGKKAKDGTYFG